MSTSTCLVKVRMLRPYMTYRAGQVVPVTGGLARSLELQRYAIRHEDDPVLQLAIQGPPPAIERAEAPVAKRRRQKRA